jgi:hypothetical protein
LERDLNIIVAIAGIAQFGENRDIIFNSIVYFSSSVAAESEWVSDASCDMHGNFVSPSDRPTLMSVSADIFDVSNEI